MCVCWVLSDPKYVSFFGIRLWSNLYLSACPIRRGKFPLSHIRHCFSVIYSTSQHRSLCFIQSHYHPVPVRSLIIAQSPSPSCSAPHQLMLSALSPSSSPSLSPQVSSSIPSHSPTHGDQMGSARDSTGLCTLSPPTGPPTITSQPTSPQTHRPITQHPSTTASNIDQSSTPSLSSPQPPNLPAPTPLPPPLPQPQPNPSLNPPVNLHPMTTRTKKSDY